MKTESRNIYLKKDPIQWILDESHHHIRYKAIIDLYSIKAESEYRAMINSPFIQQYVLSNLEKSIKRNNFDLLYKGSVWFFALGAYFSIDNRTNLMHRAAKYLCDNLQGDDGGFTMQWNPPLSVACRTGDMVYSLIKSQCCNDSIVKGLEWIKKNQRHDGGWLHCPLEDSGDMIKLALFNKTGKGHRREQDIKVTSCIYATASCLKALIAAEDRGAETMMGMEFFLNRSLYKTRINPRKTWNRGFLLTGLPLLSQYDALMGLEFAAESHNFNDHRVSEVFNHIMDMQKSDGTWNCEQFSSAMIKKSIINKEESSKLVTLRILQVLQRGGTYDAPHLSFSTS